MTTVVTHIHSYNPTVRSQATRISILLALQVCTFARSLAQHY